MQWTHCAHTSGWLWVHTGPTLSTGLSITQVAATYSNVSVYRLT